MIIVPGRLIQNLMQWSQNLKNYKEYHTVVNILQPFHIPTENLDITDAKIHQAGLKNLLKSTPVIFQ